jgi:hypothetical protein
MDDINVLERLVADEMQLRAGPDPVVDDAAIFTAITATHSPKWRFETMFSATKFVVAGAIVALFGGFLLTGLLAQRSDEPLPPAAATTSASPEADVTWTPPPELTMEEVAPGVMRAMLPGAGSFKAASGPHDFMFDAHGDLWLLSPAGLLRVGDDTTYPSPDSDGQGLADLSPAPDGALWALANDTVASFRDGAWTEAPPFPGDTEDGPRALEVLPDGTVWARSTTTLARLEGDAWTAYRITDDEGPVPDAGWVFPGDLAWTPDGSLWVTTCNTKVGVRPKDRVRTVLPGGLLRFDGEVFHQVAPLVPVQGCIGPLVSGPDGELWTYLDADPPRLARFDGTDWELFGAGAGIPRISWTGRTFGQMVAAPDGRLWVIAAPSSMADRRLGTFDGATWTAADGLASYWVREGSTLRVAPDGNLWVEPAHGLFLIATPEAVAGTE